MILGFFFASFIFCHLPRGTMNYNEKMLILYNKMLVLRKCCARKVLSFNCILTFIPCWIFCINLNKKSRVNFLKISFQSCCIVLIISYWPRAFSYYHYQHTLSYKEFLFESLKKLQRHHQKYVYVYMSSLQINTPSKLSHTEKKISFYKTYSGLKP